MRWATRVYKRVQSEQTMMHTRELCVKLLVAILQTLQFLLYPRRLENCAHICTSCTCSSTLCQFHHIYDAGVEYKNQLHVTCGVLQHSKAS